VPDHCLHDGHLLVAAAPEQVEGPPPAAEAVVLLWRVEQFQRLGFADSQCWGLARSDADLGVARRLQRAGCPVDLALRILG
jgi:hypothetical protein